MNIQEFTKLLTTTALIGSGSAVFMLNAIKYIDKHTRKLTADELLRSQVRAKVLYEETRGVYPSGDALLDNYLSSLFFNQKKFDKYLNQENMHQIERRP